MPGNGGMFQRLRGSVTGEGGGGFTVQVHLPLIIGFYLVELPRILSMGNKPLFTLMVRYFHYFLEFTHDEQYQSEVALLRQSINARLKDLPENEIRAQQEEWEFVASLKWVGSIMRLLKRHRLLPERSVIESI